MISNPEHERFYREDNDRMPAFAKDPGDAPQNMLTAHAIGLIADWLRATWYEQSAAETPIAEPPAAEPTVAKKPPAAKLQTEK